MKATPEYTPATLAQAAVRVMYAPLAYAHPDWVDPAATALAEHRPAAGNRLMIAMHRLDCRLDWLRDVDPTAARALMRWRTLPEAAVCLGVACARQAFMTGRFSLALPRSVTRTLALPVLFPALGRMRVSRTPARPGDFAELGAALLGACIAPGDDSGLALRQRLALLFPKESALTYDAWFAAKPSHRDCACAIRYVLDHVQTD
jgi:hypothetical protein